MADNAANGGLHSERDADNTVAGLAPIAGESAALLPLTGYRFNVKGRWRASHRMSMLRLTMAASAEEEEAGGENGDLAGPPPPGPGDAVEQEEEDLVGPTPPPAKKRKVQHAATVNTSTGSTS